MKITYFDLYQLHWPDRSIPLWGQTLYKKKFHDKNMKSSSLKFQSKELDETILCISELIKEGKIKAWGLSNETSYGMMMYCEACKRLNVPLPSTIQQDFGLLDRRFEESLVEICSFFNIVLLSYGTLNGGSLSGKYLDRVLDDNESKRLKVDELKQAATEKSRHVSTPGFQPRYHAKRSLNAIAKYQDLALKHNISLVHLSYAWALSRFYMGSVIIGTTNVAQVIENCASSSINLSEEIISEIDKIHDELPNPNATT